MSIRLVDANEIISAVYDYEHEKGTLTAFDVHDIIIKTQTIAHFDSVFGMSIGEVSAAVQMYKERQTDCQWK